MSVGLKASADIGNAADIGAGVNDVERSVVHRFAEMVARHAGRSAVVSDAQQWTYRQLDDVSNKLASQIEPSPGKEQQPVAILMDHGALLIASILAVLKTGRPQVVLDSTDTPERRSLTYKSSGAPIVFVDSAHRHEGQQLTGEFGQLLEVDTGHLAARKREIQPPISSDSVASIVYTSGSTGQPKGVCHSHAMVLHHNRTYTSIAQLCPDDRLSLLTPCHLAASRSALWGALLNGATLFPFDLRLHGVSALPAWIARHRITVMHCVPAVFRTLASILSDANDERSLDSLRLLRLGGESVLARDVELFRRFTSRDCKLMVTLSSTETGVVTTNVLTQDSRITGQLVPLGKAAPEMNIELIDDRGDAVPAGEIGRMVVHSYYLATGYWADSQLTSARFAADQHNPMSRAFETGDLARLNAEGQYEFCGRSDNRLKVRGHRVDLAEVEAALLTCEFIKESAVIDRTDSAGHIRLVAFVVSAVDQYRERAVRDALQHRLPNYMVPSTFVRLEKMPRTASGKIDRQALLAHEYGHCHKVIDRSNQPLWRQIADIWEQMLGKGPVGGDDDFFLDHGASSLQAASAVVKLERLAGQRVSLATLMRFRTARSLADYLAQPQHSARRSKLLAVQAGQPGNTPFFFVHGDIYGAGLYCPRFAQSLGAHRPFYAVMPLGFDGGTTPQSIPAMAHHFVGDIRRVQPKGPYLLGGFCNGGLVAFEIAQQLRRAGQQVAVLALIRAKPGMTRWPGVRTLIENLGDIAGLSSDRRVDLYWNVHDRLQRLRKALTGARRGRIRSVLKSLINSEEKSIAPIAPGSIQHADSIMNIHRKAAGVYLPPPYPGRIDVFWPQEEIAALRWAPGAGWHRFVSEVALHTVPGGHHTCITEHVKALAAPLREILDEAGW